MSLYESKQEKNTTSSSAVQTTVGQANSELVMRVGDASSEFIVAKRGVDNATGKALERSHDKISGYSNPGGNHTAQQAGFSAEVASTARSNSEFKKAGSSRRVSRSEDAGLGSNLSPAHFEYIVSYSLFLIFLSS